MSINAIEVLESRIADRIPSYHSPAWWDMMWRKHEAWREANYPAPAATEYEVTPVTGKVL